METQRSHRRALVRLGGPVYLELLAGVAAGVIGMVWVARLGGEAVVAVAVATGVENLLLGVVLTAGSGTTVLLARARGAGHPGAVRTAVRGGTALCALLVPPVALGGFLLREPLAALLLGGAGAGGAHGLTAAYLAVSLPGTAVLFAGNVVDGILKGAGDTRTPMRLAFLANGLVLVLDPLLIHAYGVPGAALATVLGRTAALAAGAAALRRHPLLRAARAAPRAGSLAAAVRRTAATGLPMAADFTVRMGGALALVAVVARLGVTETAAYGIATKGMYVATMAFYAVRQAAAIHTAHLRGAGTDGRRAVAGAAALLGTGLGAGFAAALWAGADGVMRLFGAGPEVAAAGALFLRCLVGYLPLMGGFIAAAGVFEGAGAGRRPAGITVAGVLLQLPLALALSGLGLPGVCLAMTLAMGAQGGAMALLHRRAVRAAQAERVSTLSGSG
ncbi:MATE family efflux transporter [Streptomyces omiyaensis]|uniref:Probable multidrug resistance protein NorM n=1 Tax=Streptomyces omiyaensis TaxID=68247 RepID=A0ABW7BPF7_9ACTN